MTERGDYLLYGKDNHVVVPYEFILYWKDNIIFLKNGGQVSRMRDWHYYNNAAFDEEVTKEVWETEKIRYMTWLDKKKEREVTFFNGENK